MTPTLPAAIRALIEARQKANGDEWYILNGDICLPEDGKIAMFLMDAGEVVDQHGPEILRLAEENERLLEAAKGQAVVCNIASAEMRTMRDLLVRSSAIMIPEERVKICKEIRDYLATEGKP